MVVKLELVLQCCRPVGIERLTVRVVDKVLIEISQIDGAIEVAGGLAGFWVVDLLCVV